MWTPEHRRAANRKGLRYLSDLTDAEGAIVEPMIPPTGHGGRKRSVNVREVLNGIFYVLWTGCQWKALPTDLPPKSTVASIGAQLGYIIPMGDVQGYINIKGYKEFDAVNRPEGWNVWLTLALSPAPATPSALTTPTSRMYTK